MSKWTAESVAKRLQHTNVSPDATQDDIENVCEDCIQFGFDGAMIQPCWVPFACEILNDTNIKVCTAFGYPMGGDGVDAKVANARDCIVRGADEFDFMPNMGWLKSGKHNEFKDEVQRIVDAADGRVTKIMLELGMLTHDEGQRAAELAVEAGVTYVKNSSGFGKGGKADVDIIRQLKSWVGDSAKVKASGGVKTIDQAIALFEAGAELIGTSSGISIVSGKTGHGDY